MNLPDRRLITALVRTLRSVADKIDAIHKYQQASDAQKQSQPLRTLPVEIESDPRIPIAIREHYEAENKNRKSKWRRFKNIVEVVGIASAFTLAVLTYFTLQEIRTQTENSRKSANAAKTSADIAAAELRPWVWAEIGITKPLSFSDKGARLGIVAVLHSVGRTPALHVRFQSKLYLNSMTRFMNEEARVKQSELCRHIGEISNLSYGSGDVIFPGQSRDTREVVGVSQTDITTAIGTTHISGKVEPMLIACIDYQFSGVLEHHQTVYSYSVARPMQGGGVMCCVEPRGVVNDLALVRIPGMEQAN
jgi:hypothetical protein